MESRKQHSFDKVIEYLNNEIADYEESIKECERTIYNEEYMIEQYEKAIDDYKKIRDSLVYILTF